MAQIRCNFLSYTLRRAVDLTVIIPTMCFSEMMAEKNGTLWPRSIYW